MRKQQATKDRNQTKDDMNDINYLLAIFIFSRCSFRYISSRLDLVIACKHTRALLERQTKHSIVRMSASFIGQIGWSLANLPFKMANICYPHTHKGFSHVWANDGAETYKHPNPHWKHDSHDIRHLEKFIVFACFSPTKFVMRCRIYAKQIKGIFSWINEGKRAGVYYYMQINGNARYKITCILTCLHKILYCFIVAEYQIDLHRKFNCTQIQERIYLEYGHIGKMLQKFSLTLLHVIFYCGDAAARKYETTNGDNGIFG